jgi:hypothetical protein
MIVGEFASLCRRVRSGIGQESSVERFRSNYCIICRVLVQMIARLASSVGSIHRDTLLFRCGVATAIGLLVACIPARFYRGLILEQLQLTRQLGAHCTVGSAWLVVGHQKSRVIPG